MSVQVSMTCSCFESKAKTKFTPANCIETKTVPMSQSWLKENMRLEDAKRGKTLCFVLVGRGSRELKQTRRRRKRERHLEKWLRVSATIFQLFKLIMLEKCVLTILELNWNQRLGHKTKLNICHHTLTLSTHLQNWSFHVVERTRTSSKCQKMKNARAKRAKILFFLVKYANSVCGAFVAVVVLARTKKHANTQITVNTRTC